MAAAIGSLDEEELRVRSLQGVGNAHFLPPLTNAVVPSGLSPISSIGAAPKKEVPQHRPNLAPPKHIMLDVIGSHMETERLTNKSAKIFDAEVAKNFTDIDKLAAEKQEALENEAKAAKARTTWNALSIVSQYVAGIGMIVMGSACGGWPAALLIGAGVVGIGNRVIHDTNFLQAAVAWYTKSEELQKKITHNIEMGAFFLQMGLGLAGGIWAWQAGTLAAAQINGLTIKTKMESIITGAAGVMSAGSRVGIAYYDKQIAYLLARRRDIDTQTALDHQTMYHDSTQMSKMVESAQSQTDEIRKAIQALQISQD